MTTSALAKTPAATRPARPDPAPGRARDTVEVGAIDDAAALAGAAPVAGHLDAGVGDPHRLGRDQYPDPLADQPPGHRVGVGVELHRTIGSDAPAELARR